jgi:hypothetical protein
VLSASRLPGAGQGRGSFAALCPPQESSRRGLSGMAARLSLDERYWTFHLFFDNLPCRAHKPLAGSSRSRVGTSIIPVRSAKLIFSEQHVPSN